MPRGGEAWSSAGKAEKRGGGAPFSIFGGWYMRDPKPGWYEEMSKRCGGMGMGMGMNMGMRNEGGLNISGCANGCMVSLGANGMLCILYIDGGSI